LLKKTITTLRKTRPPVGAGGLEKNKFAYGFYYSQKKLILFG